MLESGLGEALVDGGIDDDLLRLRFIVVLKNVAEEAIAKTEDLIISKLQGLVDEGFTLEAVQASMNTIEFSLRENNTSSFPPDCLCGSGCIG